MLSHAEPGIPAWLWAHRICQRPSISTQPHATPPVSVPGHCLPYFPRPPDWNFSHLPSPRRPCHTTSSSSQARGFCFLLFCIPKPTLSFRDLTVPTSCSNLSMAPISPRERGQGPQLVCQRPSGSAASPARPPSLCSTGCLPGLCPSCGQHLECPFLSIPARPVGSPKTYWVL